MNNCWGDNMSSFAKANELYKQGKFQEAYDAYMALGKIFGESVVEYQLKELRKKIELTKSESIKVEPKTDPVSKSNPVKVEPKASPAQPNPIKSDSNSAKPVTENTKLVVEKKFVQQFIDQVDDYFKAMSPLKQNPLVSVIMTSHNAEKYIESAVYSLVDQSYDNIEIIIVDDCSSDRTVEILDRLTRSTKKIKHFRLNSNLGTYYAKNLGILQSKGDIIFFHDSDDICHKYRIEICVKALEDKPEAVAVRSAYARVNADDGSIVIVDGHQYKLGLITLGIKRSVFKEIGFFNCTTKASDDELFNRMRRHYTKAKIIDVSQPLYFNTMRANSLIGDMIDWKGESEIKQNFSASRANYVKSFTDVHDKSSDNFAKLFVFPTIRDLVPVDSDMTKLANPKIPVYVNVCSIPSREQKLKRVINILYNQCDHIHVYLDGYDKIPDFLKDKKIEVVLCQDKSKSIRDNGKFILLDRLVKENKDGYYITVDDDINYPIDYVNAMIKRLNYYDDKVVLGVHGVLLPKYLDRYFSSRRKVLSFYRRLEQDKLVHLLGTGTTVFRVNQFKGFSLAGLTHTGMADVFLAIECQRRSIPLITIARFDNWVSEMEKEASNLFTEFKDNDSVQTKLLTDSLVGQDVVFDNVLPSELLKKLPPFSALGFYRA